MEKREKFEQQYFNTVAQRVTGKILSQIELTEQFKEIDEMFKISRKNYPVITKKFVEMIGGNLIESIKDPDYKKKGRKPLVYSFSNETDKMKVKIANYYKNSSSDSDKIEKSYSRTCNRKPSIKALDKVWELLLAANESDLVHNTCKGVSFRSAKDICNVSYSITENVVNQWKQELKSAGIDLGMNVIELNNGRGKVLFFGLNLKARMFDFKEKYKALTGNYPRNSNILKSIKPVDVKKQKVEGIIKDYSKEDIFIYFTIANILRESGGKLVDLDTVCAVLRSKVYINKTKNFIVELIRREPELVLVQNGNAVNFKERGSESKLITKFDPAQIKMFVLARVGLTLDEIRAYLPDAELESRITDNDGVYRFSVNYGFENLKALVKLYRSFRGTDKIFDPNLDNRLKREIAHLDAIAWKERDQLFWEK